MGDGDGIDLVSAEAGFLNGLDQRAIKPLDVCPGGDLGDDAAVFPMEVNLRGDDVAVHLMTVFDQGGGGFVTRGFNAQNQSHRIADPQRVTLMY